MENFNWKITLNFIWLVPHKWPLNTGGGKSTQAFRFFSKGWPRPLSWCKFYRTLSILVAPALYGWNSTHHFRQSRRVLCYFQFFSNLLWMTSKCQANHAASKNFGTFKSRPLNTRWPLYTMRLINGPTIKVFSLTIFHNCS